MSPSRAIRALLPILAQVAAVTAAAAAAAASQPCAVGAYRFAYCVSSSTLQGGFTASPVRSLDECAAQCNQQDTEDNRYFAVSGTTCLCPDRLEENATPVADAQCNRPCADRPDELCGGGDDGSGGGTVAFSLYISNCYTPNPDPAVVGDYRYQGCFVGDTPGVFAGFILNVEDCIALCTDQTSDFAALIPRGSQPSCSCGNGTLTQRFRPAGEVCNAPCIGNPSQRCAGTTTDANNIYALPGVAAPQLAFGSCSVPPAVVTATATSSVVSTSTTTTISTATATTTQPGSTVTSICSTATTTVLAPTCPASTPTTTVYRYSSTTTRTTTTTAPRSTEVRYTTRTTGRCSSTHYPRSAARQYRRQDGATTCTSDVYSPETVTMTVASTSTATTTVALNVTTTRTVTASATTLCQTATTTRTSTRTCPTSTRTVTTCSTTYVTKTSVPPRTTTTVTSTVCSKR